METQYATSIISSYTNIKLYTQMQWVVKVSEQVGYLDSDKNL